MGQLSGITKTETGEWMQSQGCGKEGKWSLHGNVDKREPVRRTPV